MLEEHPPLFIDGDIVEIDEKKLKWKDGEIEGNWVMGFVNRDQTLCFMTCIQNRTRGSMEGWIKRVVNVGTLVMTDALNSYVGILKSIGSTHCIINKKQDGFSRTDEKSGIHVNVNKCENMWKHLDDLIAQRKCFHATSLHRLIAEYVYTFNRKDWLDLIAI